ncbi:phosphoribosyltransferase-like protein [Sphingomonas sp. GB1N7]|uniref:phosphoribosyltransferase-like protein n=1 Tax=Parasphingomonas caseinilytica TaxID=3096158 RepID=UPI002FC99C2E
MQKVLAERLLRRVMDWDQQRLAEELPLLDRMANFKYDEYQQFGPGRKFVETLGLWLEQFDSSQREDAYEFVKGRLVYISESEMRHLVEAAYADHIKPLLIREAAGELFLATHHLGAVAQSDAFRRSLRCSLFFGLSDGARMDVFRRSANLDNEQVWQAYEPSSAKTEGLIGDLRKVYPKAFFGRVFLIDDFTASGISYIRKEPDGEWKGKIPKALKQFGTGGEASALFCDAGYRMTVVLYVATADAAAHIRQGLTEFCAEHVIPTVPELITVYQLPEAIKVTDGNPTDQPFLRLADQDRYYRTAPLDKHELKGGTKDVKRGFAGCALPLVLGHNTPNNSLYLLWGSGDDGGRGLFPRIVRHKAAG